MSLTDQVIINNFANNINEAIKDVGGDTSSVQHLCDYPRIIREQLLAANIEVEYVGGKGIEITKDGTKFIISANSGATLTNNINDIPADTSIQEVFEKLFNEILPSLPSVLKGDIIISDHNGEDQYQHPLDNPPILYVKNGLIPDSVYMRLFLNNQKEPIYISFGDVFLTDSPQDDKIYGRKNKKWVEIDGSGVTTGILSPPYPNDQDIPAGTSIQEVFEKLFDEILPSLPSVLKGDIILSSKDGSDTYQHPKYQETNTKSGLDPETYYIRLFLNSQEEPLYVSCEPLKIDSGKTYNGSTGDNIDIIVDNDENIISANLKSISDTIIENSKLQTTEVNNLFNEVFNK